MKRILSMALAVLITLLVVGCGLFMPGITFSVWHPDDGTQLTRHEVSAIQFDTLAPIRITETLRLVSGNYETINIESGRVLHAQEAYALALETVVLFLFGGIGEKLTGLYLDHTETPLLVYGEDVNSAVILWQCDLVFFSGQQRIRVLLDDATGKMVAFWSTISSSEMEYDYSATEDFTGDYSASIEVNEEELRWQAEDWAYACVKYYDLADDFEVKKLEETPYEFGYLLVFSDETGNELELVYYIAKDKGIFRFNAV